MRSHLRRLASFGTVAIVCAAAPPSDAHAEIYRQAVIVARPQGLPRRATEIEVDARAQKALIESYMSDKLSSDLMARRGERVRLLLEPVANLIDKFSVVTREEVDATRARVVCEAEIDTAALVFKLVNGKALSFGDRPPRVAFAPAPGSRLDVVQSLRGQISSTLGAAGIALLVVESATDDRNGRGSATSASIRKIADDSQADFVAVVTYNESRAPSSVGGVVLDGSLQYTLVRPHDAAIIAEQVFTERGSGASDALATRMILETLAPRVARGLGGRLAEAIFANGSVIDPSAPPQNAIVNVVARPTPAAITALMSLLRNQGLRVSLAENRVPVSRSTRTPTDQIVVEDPVTIERLFDLFASAAFGPSRALRASVFEYGDHFIGVEIVDSTPPTLPPVAERPSPAPHVNSPSVEASDERRPMPDVARTPETYAQAAATAPLQFRLSAVFASQARR